MKDEHAPLDDLLLEQATHGYATETAAQVVTALEEMVAHEDYPCLGARSVFRRDHATVIVLDDMAPDAGSVTELSAHLRRFAETADPAGEFTSFIAVFRGPIPSSEADFERSLWQVLQGLVDRDDEDWAGGVSDDPTQPHFSFSHAGTAFFVVGLHPLASRVARRAPLPTLVFNLHAQFERLREEGGFDRMRDTIRRRDVTLNGTPNPMTADYGESSEARQYSGREVGPDWVAPLTTPSTSTKEPR